MRNASDNSQWPCLVAVTTIQLYIGTTLDFTIFKILMAVNIKITNFWGPQKSIIVACCISPQTDLGCSKQDHVGKEILPWTCYPIFV
jgi:hypothetical protein